MKILCAFGRYAYGDPARGEAYEHAHFLPALRDLGHDVALFDSFDRSTYADFSALNRAFLESVERERPEVIFCVLMGYEIWQETFQMIRESVGAVLINWATDDSWKYAEFSRFVAAPFDIYATTYPAALTQSRRAGLNNFVLTQWATSGRQLATPKPARDCRHAVSFIGAAYGNRPQWIKALASRGIEVTCFGHGWPNGPVTAQAVPEIFRDSVVSLNFSDSARLIRGGRLVYNRQIKARVFEVPGAGGCLVTETADGLDRWFTPDQEIKVFHDADDLAEQIRGLLANPDKRDAMALAGQQRTAQEHTYEQRLGALLERAQAIRASRQTTGGCSINWPAFEVLAGTHQAGPALRLLAVLLKAACSLVWGRKRGPRAARRILYELSWRVCGRHTFTARGWPGRLFYHES